MVALHTPTLNALDPAALYSVPSRSRRNMRRTSISARAIACRGFSVSASASVTAETLNDRRVPLLKQLSCQRLPEAKSSRRRPSSMPRQCGERARHRRAAEDLPYTMETGDETTQARGRTDWHLRRSCCQDQCNRDKSTCTVSIVPVHGAHATHQLLFKP